MSESHTEYDVVVLGGAFSGASTALLLRRWVPDARVLIVEASDAFDYKVGEATVEVSSIFLHRVLGLYPELIEQHLPKHGLRFWASDGGAAPLSEVSEIGPATLTKLPSFQIDRSRFDEMLLAKAAGEGAEVARPARAADVELGDTASTVFIETAAGPRQVRCRWVVDATGRAGLLAKKLDLRRPVDTHPTAACWGRWTGVLDMDGPELMGRDPRSPALLPLAAARRLATNHFCGRGFWCWFIPLSDGKTSIGVVYDKRLFDFPGEGKLADRYEAFLRSLPGAADLLHEARLDRRDFRAYGHLPYRSKRVMGRGWCLVGDAAAFLDPYYSPGLDHCSMTVYTAARLIEDDLAGRLSQRALVRRLAYHNDCFVRSQVRWLEALYEDKYEIMGEADLIAAAFFMDVGLYYMAIVAPLTRRLDAFMLPPFGAPGRATKEAHRWVRFYNRRLVTIARRRRALGRAGRRNRRHRYLTGTTEPNWTSLAVFLKGLRLWLAAEVELLVAGLRPRPSSGS